MKKPLMLTLTCLAMVIGTTQAQATTALPGSIDAQGRTVLTFVASDPPGVRCNNNLQVAAGIANAFQVPIRLLPAGLEPDLPAPSVFYGDTLIAADGQDHNGMASYHLIADVLDIEGVPRQPEPGLLLKDAVNTEFEGLKGLIRGN